MLYYQMKGKGIPLLLLHAFPLHSGMWAESIDILSQYARVIAPDLPGFGKSSLLPQITISRMAESVAELLDKLSVKEPVIFCGLSMGGYVAFEFIRRYPKRIAALGLFSTRASADSSAVRKNRFKSIADIEATGAIDGFVKQVPKKLLGDTTQRKNPQLSDQVKQWIQINSPDGIIGALQAMAQRNDSTDLLESIRVPTLILAGEEDGLIPPEEARSLKDRIRGAQFHMLPQAGHLISNEQPQLFQNKVIQFIQTL